MAAGTKVQLRLGDRVVSEAVLRDGELRIGRMKENDLVINNLAVSRFHAVLRQMGTAFEIEDLGSENGTHVNGVAVRGRAPVPPGAEIAIGKHVLTLQGGAGDAAAAPRALRSDAWDAAQTYFAPELAPRPGALSGPEAGDAVAREAEAGEAELLSEAVEERAPVAAARPSRPAAASLDLPDPDGRFAFGEDDLLLPPADGDLLRVPTSEFDVSAPAAEPAVAATAVERGGETALFDFAASSDLGISEPSLARAAAPLYAGLIVERAGKVERVVPLSTGELVVGRGPTCDLVLSASGISRRHAHFVREGEGVRVLDLGSANGLRVNGEPATERQLQLGDVVAIEDYTLTYVVDREPLEQAVRGVAAPAATGTAHLTVMRSAPFASIPERDLLVEPDEDETPTELEKELEIVAELGTLPTREASRRAEVADWVVEVVLATASLPPALREALRELPAQELRLAAELRLRRRS